MGVDSNRKVMAQYKENMGMIKHQSFEGKTLKLSSSKTFGSLLFSFRFRKCNL